MAKKGQSKTVTISRKLADKIQSVFDSYGEVLDVELDSSINDEEIKQGYEEDQETLGKVSQELLTAMQK